MKKKNENQFEKSTGKKCGKPEKREGNPVVHARTQGFNITK